MAPTYKVETLRQLAAAGSSFYRGLLDDFNRFGGLTAKQVATLSERELPFAAPAVNINHIELAFAAARASGVKKPRVRLAGFTFKSSPLNGRNPGAVYVVKEIAGRDDLYLGKVLDGVFTPSRDCAQSLDFVLAALADPKAAAVAYGKAYGECSICNRTLTDPESIARGIGPVCAKRFGWLMGE